eukprot:402338_1
MSNKAGRSPVQWILLARQDLTGKNGGYFASKSEVTKNVDADINTVKLYANLKINYDEYRDYDGNLFFMIVWPGLSNSGNVAKLFVEGMIWSQTSIPTARQVENYKAIFVPYPGDGKRDFGGIEKSNYSTPSMIDGNAGIWNWHYAVGSTNKWGRKLREKWLSFKDLLLIQRAKKERIRMKRELEAAKAKASEEERKR